MVAILVILTVLVALGIDSLVLSYRTRHATRPEHAPVPMHAPEPPQGIFVDDAHAWLRITGDGRLRVGVDDFLSQALGPVQKVEVPEPGTTVERGDPLFKLTVNGRTVAIPSPASGEIVSANDRSLRDPATIHTDPYGAGWIVSLFTRNHQAAISPLLIGSEATRFLRSEFQRFADFLTPVGTSAAVPVMADGGLPGAGAAASLPADTWDKFVKEFVPAGPTKS